jgi:hypothetical protein
VFPTSARLKLPKSKTFDFGAIHLFRKNFDAKKMDHQNSVFLSSGNLNGRKSETSDLRWSSPRVTPPGGQALGQFDRATN